MYNIFIIYIYIYDIYIYIGIVLMNPLKTGKTIQVQSFINPTRLTV